MSNLILLPILLIPHIAIPAGLLYLLYLEQQETISCNKDQSTVRSRHAIPPAPPTPSYMPTQRSVRVSQRMENALKYKYESRQLRNSLMKLSHMRVINEVQLVNQKLKEVPIIAMIDNIHSPYVRKCLMDRSPMRNTAIGMSWNTLFCCDLKYWLAPVHRMIGTTSYNCHSPMRQFIKNNKSVLLQVREQHRQRAALTFTLTPMRQLAITKSFKSELACVSKNLENNYFKQQFWRAWMYNRVLSKIPVQRGIVMSKLRPVLMKNIWYAEINNALKDAYSYRMNASPMRQLAQLDTVKSTLFDTSIIKKHRQLLMDINPMRTIALTEADAISRLASRKSLNLVLNRSPMSSFVRSHKKGYRLHTKKLSGYTALDTKKLLKLVYTLNISSRANMISSPLHKYVYANRYLIIAKARALSDIIETRKSVTGQITQLLARNYGTLYRKFLLKEFRTQHHIPNVTFNSDCVNTVQIRFPLNMQTVNKFLADSNLDGFTCTTLYQDKHQFQSYAYSLLDRGTTINDLTDAAQTFKNISHLTDANTEVLMLAGNTGINILEEDSKLCTRHVSIHFVKRDRTCFKASQYESCKAKVQDFVKRHNGLEIKICFLNKWLSDEMVITIQGPVTSNYKIINHDLVHHINLIKGIIFVKSMDNVLWLHIN